MELGEPGLRRRGDSQSGEVVRLDGVRPLAGDLDLAGLADTDHGQGLG